MDSRQIMTIENIEWQACVLAQLTAATNQLAQAAAVKALTSSILLIFCYVLSIL